MEEAARKEGYLHEKYHYFHLQDTAGQERSFHYHDFDKIVILLSGKVDYTVENVTYRLIPGSVLLVRHHAIHRALIDVSEPYERIIIYMEHGYFDGIMPSARLTECFRSTDDSERCLLIPDEKSAGELKEVLSSFEASLKDTRYGSDTLRDTLMMQMLIILNRITRTAPEKDTVQPVYDEKIRTVLNYIENHLTDELTVELLAEKAYLSRYHFMRLFKSCTGSTVHEYVRQKRLLHAARLIRENVPAGEAARESGFADYSTFNRAFRSCFGVKPSDLQG